MSKQNEVIKALGVNATIDPKEEWERRVSWIEQYFRANPYLKTAVLGISGGQDSTLTGRMLSAAFSRLQQAFPEANYQFIAVRLPYGVQQDEADAQLAIEWMKPDRVVTVNIKDAVDASIATMEKATGEKVSDFLKGNEKARERMKAQYTLAAMHSGVVVGTDHAAEAISGFYTKFGDGAADILPLSGLTKRQGRQLLQHMDCPAQLYLKAPTADLEDDKPQLPDEVALGVTYEEMDDYLEGKAVSEKAKGIIENRYDKTEHKRQAPIAIWDTWWKK